MYPGDYLGLSLLYEDHSMKKKDIYTQLVRRYMENTASEHEREAFFHLLREGKLEKYLDAEMEKDARALTEDKDGSKTSVIGMRRWYWAAAAAAAVIILFAGIKWDTGKKDGDAKTVQNYYKNEVLPGGNKAILTLGDGSTVTLDSAKKGALTRQGSSLISKLDSGKIDYTTTNGEAAEVVYNTVSTPKGGQYQVVLADGTRVWLNALSSIRFPTVFNGNSRTVELTGEAYFEVAADRNKPFRVQVNGMEVAVLGTSFNINAYPDEADLKTTLLEGSVKLLRGKTDLVLKPGEQGRTADREGLALVKDADVDQAVAWKNGLFSFDDAGIETVMRQLSRWYGIDIQYEGKPTAALFWGKMERDLNLTQVLDGLSKSKVHFHLDGNRLTVLP